MVIRIQAVAHMTCSNCKNDIDSGCSNCENPFENGAMVYCREMRYGTDHLCEDCYNEESEEDE